MSRRGLVGRVSAARSKNMSAIKGKNTKPELLLRKHLSALGLRYRLHQSNLPGKPDIVFTKLKIAIFCDGDFWHGRNWENRKRNGEFKIRNKFWTEKIEKNIARDEKNNHSLKSNGWIVIRVWTTDIIKDASKIALKVNCKIKEKTKK